MTEHPAHLLVGSQQECIAAALKALQIVFCKHHGCSRCLTCQQITQQQHHAITWITPEKNYTLELIEPIINTLAFSLADDQHYFFVLQKSDTLSAACANRLLKSLEEPPRGYHFILFAQRLSGVLPTIRSRCLIQTITDTGQQTTSHPLQQFFLSPKAEQLNAFLAALQTSTITEQESVELVDELLRYWLDLHKREIIAQDQKKQTKHMITLLEKNLLTPPMPGSAKIFWKNLYLAAMS